MKSNLQVLRRREVQIKTGLPASSLYFLISMGLFPKPIQLSKRRVGWLAHEVDEWLQERANERKDSRLQIPESLALLPPCSAQETSNLNRKPK